MIAGSAGHQQSFVLFRGNDVLLRSTRPIQPLLLSVADLALLDEPIQVVEIGSFDNHAVTAVELPTTADLSPVIGGIVEFRSLQALDEPVEPDIWQLLSRAHALLNWNRESTFCARCGAPTIVESGGRLRSCSNPDCDAVHFPQTSPAVIVRVISKGRILLAREASYRPTRRAVLAGFVEPGESLEQTVRREVLEEVGLHVGELRYLSSQPWPFPMNLMVAFEAIALDDEIRCDQVEIEAADWYSREEVREAVAAGTLSLPTKKSIAYHMIQDWVLGEY